jgi:hypothetical protein
MEPPEGGPVVAVNLLQSGRCGCRDGDISRYTFWCFWVFGCICVMHHAKQSKAKRGDLPARLQLQLQQVA